MIEMNVVINQAASMLAIAPIFAAVYQVYLKRPVAVRTRSEVESALSQLKTSEIVELPTGTFDVSPPTAGLNYTLTVSDQGGGDNIGILQISNAAGIPFSAVTKTMDEEPVHHENVSGTIVLNQPGGTVQMIAEPVGAGPKMNIFGALIYRPKGQKVFP